MGEPRLQALGVLGGQLDPRPLGGPHHDGLRRLVLFEPRGHGAMCAAFLVPPSDSAADTGIVFVEPLGVVHMCGHGAIAIATMLVETGARGAVARVAG